MNSIHITSSTLEPVKLTYNKDPRVNFTNNMGSAEYSITGACGYEDTNDDDQVFTLGLRRNNAPAVGNYTIQTCNALANSSGGIDLDNVMTQVCGDLA